MHVEVIEQFVGTSFFYFVGSRNWICPGWWWLYLAQSQRLQSVARGIIVLGLWVSWCKGMLEQNCPLCGSWEAKTDKGGFRPLPESFHPCPNALYLWLLLWINLSAKQGAHDQVSSKWLVPPARTSFFFFNILCIWVFWFHMSELHTCEVSARGQKRVMDLLGLEFRWLWVALWVLGCNWSSARTGSTLNQGVVLQPLRSSWF